MMALSLLFRLDGDSAILNWKQLHNICMSWKVQQ